MKLARYGDIHEEKPCIIDDQGNIRDLCAYIHDISSLYLTEKTLSDILDVDIENLPLISDVRKIRLGPCIHHVGKLICIGLNSRKHIQEMGLTSTNEIVFFLKATSAICGPNDPIIYPKVGKKVDWEAELALVIGKKCKSVSEERALDYVLGFTCMNDISDRYWQLETAGGNQHTRGKSFDSFAPLGPYIVTKDEIADISQLNITCSINGELRQNFFVRDYTFNPQQIISFLSNMFTLYPGDVISLGSGPGTANGWNNQFLQVGDTVEMHIDKLGKQTHLIIQEQ